MGCCGAFNTESPPMIALVDCNNFFASCERLFRPDLKDAPVLVLSSNDGCVVARSNEVKKLSISMGVPYFKVRDIVKQHNVQCFSSNFSLYSNISQRIIGVLEGHAPRIEVYSIDEAFMDLSQLVVEDFQVWGDTLQAEIAKNIGMPVSIGVAPTKTLAKLASGYAKKQQQTCVLEPMKEDGAYKSVLEKTPVEAVWGVGWRLAPKLRQAGIRTAWQLANTSKAWIHQQFGINGIRMLAELNGEVAFPFEQEHAPQKTIMASRSFAHTIKSYHELETAVASFTTKVAFRLRRHSQQASSFGVYLRYKTPDNEPKSQSSYKKLAVATNNTAELVTVALEILRELYDPVLGYQKAGVFGNQLSSAKVCQLDLFDTLSVKDRRKRKSFMQAIDSINGRYGEGTIHVGAIDPQATRWHAKKELISPAYTTRWFDLPLVYPKK